MGYALKRPMAGRSKNHGGCVFFGRKPDLMVIRFQGYQKCHSLTRWWQLRCFLNFHRRKLGEKMKPFWRQAYFWKGLGWNHQLGLFGKPGRNVHFLTFGKGFSKRGLMFGGAVNWGSFFFWKRPSLSLRVYFWGGGCQFPSKKRCNFQLMPVLFWNMRNWS